MRFGRRMFLQASGTGAAALAIPTLWSLVPKALRAQEAAPPVRYVQWVTDHGVYADRFWPSTAGMSEVMPGVRAMALRDVAGRLSEVLGPDFDAIRDQINVVKGLDLLVDANLHNACVPTCGSWPREDNHIPFFAYSVDSIMEESSKIYPSPARVPALRLTPGVNSSYKWGSFSWTTRSGAPFKLPAYDSTATAFAAVFGDGATAGDSPLVDPETVARVRLADQVMDDYRAVMGNRSLSSADRQQLSEYMDLLSEVQTRIQVQAPECTPPSQLTESDFELLHKNATDIAVAAMLCGATRVVAYHCYQGAPDSYDEETFHAWAHDNAPLHTTLQNWRYKQLAKLIATMDAVVESNGKTLLENSFLYAGNELSDPQHGGAHLKSMPIITAGNAGGQVISGQYIDYGARLMNSMLVTAFSAMGLVAADYERNGVVGFGDYVGRESGTYAEQLTDAARRAPLPFLFGG